MTHMLCVPKCLSLPALYEASSPAQVLLAKSLRAEQTCRDVQLELELYLTM